MTIPKLIYVSVLDNISINHLPIGIEYLIVKLYNLTKLNINCNLPYTLKLIYIDTFLLNEDLRQQYKKNSKDDLQFEDIKFKLPFGCKIYHCKSKFNRLPYVVGIYGYQLIFKEKILKEAYEKYENLLFEGKHYNIKTQTYKNLEYAILNNYITFYD